MINYDRIKKIGGKIMLNGVLIIDKEEGMTSRDVVNKVSHLLGTKKVGHTGTLDPLATGVLVVTIGKCTKLNEVLTATYKEYIATFTLGTLTDTLDSTGKILKKEKVHTTKEEVMNALRHFKTTYEQEVPLYSAVKINGKKCYEYAREGKSVSLPKRKVTIKELELLEYSEKEIKIKCLVSKGTYIRSLIRDIGEYLHFYATMTSLRRTKQGEFSIKDAISLKEIEKGKLPLLKVEEVLDVLVIKNYSELKRVLNGGKIAYSTDKEYLLFLDELDEYLCLYKREGDYFKMFISFV